METIQLLQDIKYKRKLFASYFGMTLIPVLALFVAFQRYLVEGIASTGIKG